MDKKYITHVDVIRLQPVGFEVGVSATLVVGSGLLRGRVDSCSANSHVKILGCFVTWTDGKVAAA